VDNAPDDSFKIFRTAAPQNVLKSAHFSAFFCILVRSVPSYTVMSPDVRYLFAKVRIAQLKSKRWAAPDIDYDAASTESTTKLSVP
jgi:hypothetical protein